MCVSHPPSRGKGEEDPADNELLLGRASLTHSLGHQSHLPVAHLHDTHDWHVGDLSLDSGGFYQRFHLVVGDFRENI